MCRGDAGQLLLDLLANLENPHAVASLTWMKDGQVVQNPNRPTERHLDQWPVPDCESLQLDYVESMPLDVPVVLSMGRFTTMHTSRGCPWPCIFCDIPIFNEGKWRARSPQHMVAELKHLEALGYESVGFVDDHFVLQPKRIEAIGNGIMDAKLSIRWGIEGRVDSVAQHLFPAMAKANCGAMMFGIESGSQKILDRLKKEQALDQVTTAVKNAKKTRVEIVHGFFTVGNPDETIEDMEATFDFASALALDTFGFNRVCVYRGTPLRQEYVKRGLVNETTDWYKYFKCSEIDPTCLSGETINQIRQAGIKKLFRYKLIHYPRQTFQLLRRFFRYMPIRDVLYLLLKPFMGQKKGATKAEVVSRLVVHADMKDATAQLTQVSDELLHNVFEASCLERLQIQQAAEESRELPMV
ncbi:MAG: radical SAM protein [Nitrospira sp.]